MLKNSQKTSLRIPSQLPEFLRDDPTYQNFILFLEAYYEWMEQNQGILDRSKNLLNYKDIDKTSNEFLDYFYNDFLSYFPKEILADKVKVTKIAKELYKSKGTPASYKFLFKILYNSDVDFFYTKDAVLRASSGKWYVAKSLKIAQIDDNYELFKQFLNTKSLRVFGETTKSIAVIENVIQAATKMEVFVSNIERLFQSGEIVRIVDTNNQDILYEGLPIKGKVVGQISQIKIDPNNRGLLYQPGDPVVVHDGLLSNTAHGAVATVGTTTKGSIQRISVLNGGYGYRTYPNTTINITNSLGAVAVVGSLNPAANGVANVSFVPTDYIGKKAAITIGALNYTFSNIITSNANTTLANAFTFTSFQTYPISSVIVQNGGAGISQIPQVSALSSYYSEDDQYRVDLRTLGILSPIQISAGGDGYGINDTITLSGGSGYGAYANVTAVDANGSILSVSYVYPPNDAPHHYPLGGMGYKNNQLPNLTINPSNISAANASLYVPGILGDGATFAVSVDRVGAVTSINITDAGEDYIATPNVSLLVQDIVVTNLSLTNLPLKGDAVYQGTDFINSTYQGYVDSINLLTPFADPADSLWTLRVYNYSSTPDNQLVLKINNKDLEMTISPDYDIVNYGDGTARAIALFLNGLVVSQGEYLDTTGQPSSYDVLQSNIYNNYTYEITLEKEIAKYRDTLLNLLHPTGTNVVGRYALKSNANFKFSNTNQMEKGYPLSHYTDGIGTYVTMTSDWSNYSNNIVTFENLNGVNLDDIISPNDSITIVTSNGFIIHSQITEVNAGMTGQSNTAILKNNTWLTFSNVSYISANSGEDVINITSLTDSYDIINNGIYSNTSYPLMDIIYAGDKILVANNTERVVTNINYENGIITVDSPLTSNSNSLMSVIRTIQTTDVRIDKIISSDYSEF